MKRMIAISLLVLLPTLLQARVWTVELDGSGDFTNIQPAVDASASGDTVLIGPGRWDQLYAYTIPTGGWTDQVIVAIDYKNLTLIGSGQGVTIIGPPEMPPLGNPGPIGIVVGSDYDLVVKGLTIENMSSGLYFWARQLYVEDVQFKECYIGALPWATHGTVFSDCRFDQCTNHGILATSRANGIRIQDCDFSELTLFHISLQQVQNVLIEGCEFSGGNISIQFDGADCYGTIQDCVVHSGYGPHFSAVTNSNMNLIGNRLVGGNKQLQVVGYATISGEGNVLSGTDLEGGGFATIYAALGQVDLHNGHILRGNAEYTILFEYYSQFDFILQHLENNYWGTTEPDSIAAWIYNEEDDPGLNIKTYIEPFYDHPIPNEKASMSDLKRTFR